jgi:hypothetical protein
MRRVACRPVRWAWLIVVLAVAACGAPTPAPAAPPTPAGAAASAEAIAVEPPPDPGTDLADVATRNPDGRLLRFADGTYIGGVAVVAGPFRSMGLARGARLCSWTLRNQQDLPGASGASGDSVIIAAGVARNPGEIQRVVVEVGQQITTAGCDPWIYYGP